MARAPDDANYFGWIEAATFAQGPHDRIRPENENPTVVTNYRSQESDVPDWETVDITETDPSAKDNPSPVIAPRVRRP